ncbi:class I adenylate-forming enzyme family protein [Nocardioides montaniterrae]
MTAGYLPWTRPASYDDRPCVGDERQTLTYRQLGQRVDAAAEQLAELGVGPGSVIAVKLPNRVETLVAIMAAWRLGAAATPMNPTFTAAEAAHQISDSGSVVVVAEDGERLEGVTVIPVGELRTERRGADLPTAVTDDADLALLIYTSGSTGKPKGVMLSHANLHAMVEMMGAQMGVATDDHCLLVLPLFHANALLVSCLLPLSRGARISLLARFHPVSFLESIATLRPTYFSAVPTIYAHLLAAVDAGVPADTSSVRVAICGAAPAPAGLLPRAEEVFGFPIVEGYGLSEGTCASTCNPPDGVRKPGTVGVALPGQTVAIMAPDGTLLPAGERGEVVIQGANVMQGYLGNPEATAQTLGDGWLHTGDVGILDEDGYLRIVDRIKDMIIRGGENIYPKEVEAVLEAHPDVTEAAVVGKPDPALGEVVAAFVALTPSATVDEDALKAHCAEQLTKIKVPVSVTILDALPKNAVGKNDKPTLRRQLADQTQGA